MTHEKSIAAALTLRTIANIKRQLADTHRRDADQSRCWRLDEEATHLDAGADALDQLAASAPPVQETWQPIDTAPRNGTEVLVCCTNRAGLPGTVVAHFMAGGHCIEDHPAIDQGWYFWNGGMFTTATKPTHWAPLPAPPERPPHG